MGGSNIVVWSGIGLNIKLGPVFFQNKNVDIKFSAHNASL